MTTTKRTADGATQVIDLKGKSIEISVPKVGQGFTIFGQDVETETIALETERVKGQKATTILRNGLQVCVITDQEVKAAEKEGGIEALIQQRVLQPKPEKGAVINTSTSIKMEPGETAEMIENGERPQPQAAKDAAAKNGTAAATSTAKEPRNLDFPTSYGISTKLKAKLETLEASKSYADCVALSAERVGYWQGWWESTVSEKRPEGSIRYAEELGAWKNVHARYEKLAEQQATETPAAPAEQTEASESQEANEATADVLLKASEASAEAAQEGDQS